MRRWAEQPLLIKLIVYALIGASFAVVSSYTWARGNQHTCDEPENPCASPQQMADWLKHDQNNFVHLAPSFEFTPHFRKMAIAYHRAHPPKHDVCGLPWWPCFRAHATCAGSLPSQWWGCNVASDKVLSDNEHRQLNQVQQVWLACGGLAVIGSIRGGLTAAWGLGWPCLFTAWAVSQKRWLDQEVGG